MQWLWCFCDLRCWYVWSKSWLYESFTTRPQRRFCFITIFFYKTKYLWFITILFYCCCVHRPQHTQGQKMEVAFSIKPPGTSDQSRESKTRIQAKGNVKDGPRSRKIRPPGTTTDDIAHPIERQSEGLCRKNKKKNARTNNPAASVPATATKQRNHPASAKR